MAGAEATRALDDDLSGGSTDAGAYMASAPGREVILRPNTMADFTANEVPQGWTVTSYLPGGSATLGPGGITLDGAWVGCDSVFRGPPRILDFSATFAARPDQHAGFGLDYVHTPWIMFSTKWGRRLYARTHQVLVEDQKIAGSWFGEAHRFRIEWNLLDITFFIDDERTSYLLVPVPGYMRALAGNQRLGGPPLEVHWMRVSPYVNAGSFTSTVLDAGAPVLWLDASWLADVPAGTDLRFTVRTGDAHQPDPTWSPWKAVEASGDPLGVTARYLQYRAALTTTDDGRTPTLRHTTFRHRVAG